MMIGSIGTSKPNCQTTHPTLGSCIVYDGHLEDGKPHQYLNETGEIVTPAETAKEFVEALRPMATAE